MDTVIPLFPKDKSGATATGKARCFGCNHEWMAVAPFGTNLFECPRCGIYKGVFIHPYVPEEVWECSCGNDLFFISYTGILCPNCGMEQSFTESKDAS